MTAPDRFEFYLRTIEEKFRIANKEENFAAAVFKTGVRTEFFMLEALSRLYAKISGDKKFDILKRKFKQIEDALGAVDFYNALEAEAIGAETPENIRHFLAEKKLEQMNELAGMLKKGKWLGKDQTAINSIRATLKKINWPKPQDEAKALAWFYRKAINKLLGFSTVAATGFTEMEDQVHDFRRKLRWLSIYPQALRGAIQLNDQGETDTKLVKYLTPDVLNSPYNKLPDDPALSSVLLLNKPEFLAMSWLINELGLIKDRGLKILEYAAALRDTENLKKSRALEKAQRLAGIEHTTIPAMLSAASAICKTFFNDHVPDRLLHGASTLKEIPLSLQLKKN